MKSNNTSLRIVLALLMGVAIAISAFVAPALFVMSKDVWLPPSFLTHTLMLLASYMIIVFLSRGKLSGYGFTRGSFRMTPTIFLWILPTSFLAVLQYAALRSGAPTPDVFNLSHLQVVLFIWIYASICEETFVRGLLQGYLSPLGQHKVTFLRNWSLSFPVLFGGFFFGAMHIVLWTKMGPLAIMPMSLATGLGIITGYYREKTGSLIPAVLIHSLFNIGGSLPLWVLIGFTT
jgi:membrane protease YdiL (CAAX protease family)